MVMPLRPTDGLVSRLLQQQSRSQPVPVASPPTSGKEDRISISSQARETQTQNNPNKQQKLESQLLSLYSQHQTGGGKL